MSEKKFVIKLSDGWAYCDVFEGWIGTRLESNKRIFDTFDEAQRIALENYDKSKWGMWNIQEVLTKASPNAL